MALLARLPWSGQRALGTPLGALLRALLGERRRIALRNLELCFPGLDAAAREALLREHFRSLAIGVFEFARAWWGSVDPLRRGIEVEGLEHIAAARAKSEEHTSELQSLMRISYAVFCLKKKTNMPTTNLIVKQ